MKKSDANHLRRLLGWVRCEIGQSPEDLVATVNDIRAKIFPNGGISDEGKARTVAAYDTARKVPAYVRSSVKALEKALQPGDIIGDPMPEILAIDSLGVTAQLSVALSALVKLYENDAGCRSLPEYKAAKAALAKFSVT